MTTGKQGITVLPHAGPALASTTHRRRILVKVGGAQLEAAEARAELAASVVDARDNGVEVVLVHGGGPQIRAFSKRLGIEDRYHDGLRITDAETSELALMTLGGSVGRTLVLALSAAGVPAVSLTGADGGTFTARPHRPDGHDLGYVGVPAMVRPELVECLLSWGAVPVLATVAPLDPGEAGDASRFYNINADHAVAPLARALSCEAILFVTDVEGVRDASGRTRPTLSRIQAAALKRDGALQGGMIPKVEAALDAVAGHPGALVKIVPGGSDALTRALDDQVGTRFLPDGRVPA